MASPLTSNSNHNNRNQPAVPGGRDMFSPKTSAAVMALSSLHNFGAAAPTPTARPTADSMTGTRLFNQGGGGGAKPSDSPPMPSEGYTPAPYAHGAVTWGNFHVHPVEPPSLLGPSPPISRSSSLSLGIPMPENVMSSHGPPHGYARKATDTSFVTPTPKKYKVDQEYSRKNKSLGVLAENFIQTYVNNEPGSDIVVDQAARALNVERRRIYDVVNILESIRVVGKEKKNTYKWLGLANMDQVFGELQAQAILDYAKDAKENLTNIDQEEQVERVQVKSRPIIRTLSGVKENKSLAKLSQEFLQVYLVGLKLLSLPEASEKIQGSLSMEELISIGGGDTVGQYEDLDEEEKKKAKVAAARGLKTKIRRLYDIANVFISVGLLRKVDTTPTSSRRPSFAWDYKHSAQEIRDMHVERMNNKTAQDSGAKVERMPSISSEASSTQEFVRAQQQDASKESVSMLKHFPEFGP